MSMTPAATPTTATNDSAHTLQCMEVWGGASHANHAASVPGLDIYVQSTPFAEQGEDVVGGGDVYYISRCGSGRVTRIALADVSGHGTQAHAVAKKLRKAMRKSVNIANQSKLARALNRAFDQLEQGGRFATALLATYYAPTDHLVFVNAGHPPPLLRSKSTGRWTPLDAQTPGILTDSTPALGMRNLPLGVIDSTDYQQLAIHLDPGDCVLMYTDAYSEATNIQGEMLGTRGFVDLLNDLESKQPGGIQPDALIGTINGWLGDYRTASAQDDETLLLLHHNGANPEKLSLREKLDIVAQTLGLRSRDTAPSLV